MAKYLPNHKISKNYDGNRVDVSFDFTEVNRAIAFMESNAGAEMANAIADRLRRQIPRTQSMINSSVPPRKRFMAREVADSLAVDIGVSAAGEAQVRFGSEPMDDGGVTGSRGGKLALMLEGGVKSFNYPFTFKTIEPSPSFAVGSTGVGNFINAKLKPRYPAYDGIGYLAEALAEVSGDIEEIIIERLQERFA
jgi:hypothetical protein